MDNSNELKFRFAAYVAISLKRAQQKHEKNKRLYNGKLTPLELGVEPSCTFEDCAFDKNVSLQPQCVFQPFVVASV